MLEIWNRSGKDVQERFPNVHVMHSETWGVVHGANWLLLLLVAMENVAFADAVFALVD